MAAHAEGAQSGGGRAGAPAEPVGVVAALARFPVKSMGGEEPDEVLVEARGVVGDRALALVDVGDGLVASAKHPRKWGVLLRLRAAFVDEPRPDRPTPPVVISGEDGVIGRSDDAGIDDVLSRVVGREVRLVASPPEQRRFEEVWPDIDGLAPAGFVERTRAHTEPTGEAVSELGLASAAPAGTFFDLTTLHLLTTGTLATLRGLAPEADFDWRRYRPNVLVETRSGSPPFPENGWGGAEVSVGEAVAGGVVPTMRCVMTTLAHGPVPADRASLRAIARHNRVDIPGWGTWACAGLYADVRRPGRVRVGDPVAVALPTP